MTGNRRIVNRPPPPPLPKADTLEEMAKYEDFEMTEGDEIAKYPGETQQEIEEAYNDELTSSKMTRDQVFKKIPQGSYERKNMLLRIMANTMQALLPYEVKFTSAMMSKKLNKQVKVLKFGPYCVYSQKLNRKIGRKVISKKKCEIMSELKKLASLNNQDFNL